MVKIRSLWLIMLILLSKWKTPFFFNICILTSQQDIPLETAWCFPPWWIFSPPHYSDLGMAAQPELPSPTVQHHMTCKGRNILNVLKPKFSYTHKDCWCVKCWEPLDIDHVLLRPLQNKNLFLITLFQKIECGMIFLIYFFPFLDFLLIGKILSG